jgi:hypothetical protein
LSFKELCQLWHELIAGETPTMRNSSPSKLALWMEYSFADLDKAPKAPISLPSTSLLASYRTAD